MILADNDCPNTLQVRDNKNNDWVFVEAIPDAFICNVADMLATWTNGIYLSTPHRALPPASKARLSVPFFYDPSYDAVIRPIDALVKRSGKPPSSAPIRYGDHLYKASQNLVFDEK